MTQQTGETTFGLQVMVNGEPFSMFSTISVKRTIKQFVDTFKIEMFNPQSQFSTTIPLGGILSVSDYNSEFFRGLIETKETYLDNVGSHMTLSGREELVFLTEDDIDPTLGPFTNINDNDVISLIMKNRQIPWTLDLGTPVFMTELKIPPNSMTVGQVFDQIAQRNNNIFIKRGLTLMKRQIPMAPNLDTLSNTFTITKVDGQLRLNQSRVLTVTITEDITAAKSIIVGYTYQGSKTKVMSKYSGENTDLEAGTYAKRVRNQGNLEGTGIVRHYYSEKTTKRGDQLQGAVQRALLDGDLQVDLVLTVAGLVNIDLLDTVDVRIEQEGIMQYMYVKEIEYRLDANNQRTTVINVSPYPMFTFTQ